MQQKLYTILALLSCCSLLFFPGCNSDQSVDDQLVADAKDEQEEEKVVVTVEDGPVGGRIEPVAVDAVPVGVGVVAPVPVVEVVPPPPGPLPPPPPAPLIPHGDFGKHEHHGNKDEERKPKPPKPHHPKCGDGKQEVLPDSRQCKFRIYGSTNNTNDIDLYGFDEEGEAKHVGDITGGLSKVYALDFDPQGQLYGLGVRSSDGAIVYFSLDCKTAEATILGDTGLNHSFVVTDMDFDSIGRLFAYVDDGDNTDQVGIINHVLGTPTVGQYIELGTSGLDDELGNGIGSSPFPDDPLYHAGDASGLSILSKATGAATVLTGTIVFPSSVSGLSPFINSMDNDPRTNTMFVVFQDNTQAFFLATLDVNTGVVSFIREDHKKKKHETAPSGLNTITVNRRYEECDFKAITPVLPPGTSCTDECLVIESDCEDGIDNDQNGLIDCQDPACLNQECNDHNGCNPEAICTSDGNCTPVNPNFNPCVDLIHNECAATTCNSTSDTTFFCSYDLDTSKTAFGSCTPDDNCAARNADGTCDDILSQCELGRCVIDDVCPLDEDSPIITCVGQNRNSIPVGVCSNSGDVCVDLVNSSDCPQGGTCVPQGTPTQPGCLDDNPCTADSCLEDQGCEYEALAGILCDSGNLCKRSECQIVSGLPICVEISNVPDNTECTSSNPCRIGACIAGECTEPMTAPDGTPCTAINDDCERGAGQCFSGQCHGTATVTCTFNTDCASNACICPGGELALPGDRCTITDSGVCACATRPCSACGAAEGGGAACRTLTGRTFGECLVNGCTFGVCDIESSCIDLTNDSLFCPNCSGNACTESLCTDDGCQTTILDGAIPCAIVIPGSGPNTGLCAGTISCDNGFEQGICNSASTNPGSECFDDDDCPQGACEFPGTCTAGNLGQQCFSDGDCGQGGHCQLRTCLGGNGNGLGCTMDINCGGGKCVQGCVETQPPNCTPDSL